MHFYAAGLGIYFGDMGELTQVEIGVEFAIDARQQIKIEGGGHSDFVVIGFNQVRRRLFQIRAQQKRIPGLENTANFGQEFYPSLPIEIANRAAEKHYKKMLIALAV